MTELLGVLLGLILGFVVGWVIGILSLAWTIERGSSSQYIKRDRAEDSDGK